MKICLSLILAVALALTTFTVFAEGTEVTNLKIGLSKTTMKVGETQKMIISVTPTDASPVLEYESDNPDVVTAAIGALIANKEGTANITVRVSGTEISDTVQIVVSNKEEACKDDSGDDDAENVPTEEIVKVKKITVENKTIYIERYESERIAYSISPDNATNDNVTFRSSNTSVATVDDDGNVGSIGGVKYKVLGAASGDADLFLVPAGDNYKEALRVKKEKNLNIEIISVKTVDEAIEKLSKLKKR